MPRKISHNDESVNRALSQLEQDGKALDRIQRRIANQVRLRNMKKATSQKILAKIYRDFDRGKSMKKIARKFGFKHNEIVYLWHHRSDK